jgi:hypothetical protein
MSRKEKPRREPGPRRNVKKQVEIKPKEPADPRAIENLFSRMVISDLKRARCKNEQLTAIILGTVSTTIAFLRSERREILRTSPTASQLAKQESDFENRLLSSVAMALPRGRKSGRKKGQKDPDTLRKFMRIIELKAELKSREEIGKALILEFGRTSTVESYKKIYERHLPSFLKALRPLYFPEFPEHIFLPAALRAAKGRPGRPKKSGHKSSQ